MEPQFVHKKSLGQHFLTSNVIPEKLCAAGAVGAGDVVVEIGPGTGVLTAALLARGATVIAIETDARAITHLEERFKDEITAQKLVISAQDARDLDLNGLGLTDHGYKVVANIPYYLSGWLFRCFLEHPTLQPHTLVFLVQKEVAERICRDPKSSLLSLSVSVFGEARYVTTVSRGHFNPLPRVDSAIVAVTNITRERLKGVAPGAFFTLLHQAFGQRRKQLLGVLATQYDRKTVAQIISDLGFPPTVRAEDIGCQAWVTLAKALLAHNP
jgi:16S rRNA (adenine1518-N6/adenine1519-N6)-dimethyltransferase